MADTKISALTAATTPLAGTEVLPIVQSGSTVKVSVANLTAGRAISATTVTTTAANAMASTGGGTGAGYSYITNTGGQLYWGVTSSTGTGLGSGNNNYSAVITTFNATDLALGTNAVNRVNITSTGDVSVASGNVAFATAAKGVNFTANTPAAGMTSQLLNWYEEGTWTGELKGSTGSASTPVTATGKYTRIGRSVTVTISFSNVNTTGASGVTVVTGLPFSAADEAIGSLTQIGLSTDVTVAYVSGTQMEMIRNIGFSNVTISTGTGKYLIFTVTYNV